MRVIQDSDDESDENLEVDAPLPKQSDASEKPRTNGLSQQGTGSTGKTNFPCCRFL